MRSGGATHKMMEAPRSIEISLKRVPPWRRGRPKAGIDCPEGAELCRMVKRTYGITGKRSGTDEVNPATMDCASSRHSILRLWRGPSPRACSAEKNHAVCKPNPQFLPTYFCFQTSGLAPGAGRPFITFESLARIRNEELGMRNEGGGFAANIYGAMPEGRREEV